MPGVDVASPKGDDGAAVAARLLRALARRAPPSEIVDLRAALAAMGDSRALLLQAVQHVRQLSVAALVAAQEAGDLDGVRRQAHRLSGEASYVRARGFCAACNELSKFRGDVEAARPLVRATVARFEALVAALAQAEEEWGDDSGVGGGGGGVGGGGGGGGGDGTGGGGAGTPSPG